jgi:hypothetical protein
MKTTLMQRQAIANPRRTTLAHLKDVSELTRGTAAGSDGAGGTGTASAGAPAGARVLPTRTANPRRTVLTELPSAAAAVPVS